MAWFSHNTLYPVVEWLWRRIAFLWRCVKNMFSLIVYTLLPVRWRKDRGGQGLPEINPEVKVAGTSSPNEVRSCGEGQPETAAPKRVADCNQELTCNKRQRFDTNYSESDEDGEQSDEDEDGEQCDEDGVQCDKDGEQCDEDEDGVQCDKDGEQCDEDEDGEQCDKDEDGVQCDKDGEQCDEDEDGEQCDEDGDGERCDEDGEQCDEDEDGEEYRVETTDELYCGYDSTWETKQHQESTSLRKRRPVAHNHYQFSRFENAAKDMHNYRHDYPSQSRIQRWNNRSDDQPNLMFYLGETYSVPDDVCISEFHNDWYGQYDRLERVHSYIQWLFPLQEPGMNYQATPLTKEEILGFLHNNAAKENLLKSYKLMLDFYGIQLLNEKTGELKRAANWRDRFNNLNSHTHNNLRITRILKCLGTLGYPHYQEPLVRFFLEETLVCGELPNIKDSVLNYFVFAVRDKKQRRNLVKFAYLSYDRKDEFVWCPMKIQMLWSRLSVSEHQQGMKGKKKMLMSST